MPRNEHVEQFDGFEQFEERLPGALTGAADAFPPAHPDLARRAAVRGRRLKRARVVQVTGAAAVVLSLVGLGAYTGLGSGGGSTPASVDPAGTSRPTASGLPARGATPALSVSDADMVKTFKSTLPKGGSVTKASGHGSSAGDGQAFTAKLTYTAARGSSVIDLSLVRLAPNRPKGQNGQAGCLPVEVRPYDVCTTRTLPDGSSVSTTKSYTYPNSSTGQRRWYAVRTTQDGAQLYAEEFGRGGEKESTSNAEPVLTMDQLTAVVASAKWQRAIAALPAPQAPPTVSPSATPTVPSADRMTSTLSALLPRTGSRTDWNAQEGYVQVVFNDGHGKNMIGVNVQEGMSDVAADIMSCREPHSYCSVTTLPDGTQVKASKEPSEKGGKAVAWQVDTLTPSGRRIVVREVNSYSEAGPVTRPEPALSLEQLTKIARSPMWLLR